MAAVAVEVAVAGALAVAAGSDVGDEAAEELVGIRVGNGDDVAASVGWSEVLVGKSLGTRVFAGNAE